MGLCGSDIKVKGSILVKDEIKKENEKKELEKEGIEKNIKEEKEDIVLRNKNKEKHLEIKFKIKLNKEKDEIYKVYELSDNRIAVELDKSIKIYSLKIIN